MGMLEMLVYLPVVGAIIGWTCKWVAIKMLFHPAEFVGIGPIGWQGIVQRRAPKFAGGVAETVEHSGLTVDELLTRIDPDEVASLLGPTIDEAAPAVVRDVAEAVEPGLWQTLAPQAQEAVVTHLQGEGRRIVSSLVTSLGPVLNEVIDVKELVVAQLSGENKNRLARLMQRVGSRELQFVIYYGAVLGFFIGVLEVAGYAFMEKWWVLPLVGALDGLVNNWLAIQMIFRPLEKKRYLGIFPYQGLFPARQQEIATEYAKMMAEEILAPKDVLAHVTENGGMRILGAALETVGAEIEQQLGVLSTLVGVEVGPEAHAAAMAVLMSHLSEVAPAVLPEVELYLEKRLEVRATIEEKLQSMPKAEFEDVLRGIFEEDEKTLITIGGFLGGLIGLLQAGVLLLFS